AAKHGFAGQRRVAQAIRCGYAILSGFSEKSLVETCQGLKKVYAGRPDLIPFLDEHRPGLVEELYGLESLALLAQGNAGLAQSLCRFIAHAEFFEPMEGVLRKLCCIPVKIQFQINLSQVELAQCCMIGVARSLRLFAGRSQSINRPPVLPSQVVQVGDVVLGLSDRQG